jgi:hypothetical protein
MYAAANLLLQYDIGAIEIAQVHACTIVPWDPIALHLHVVVDKGAHQNILKRGGR